MPKMEHGKIIEGDILDMVEPWRHRSSGEAVTITMLGDEIERMRLVISEARQDLEDNDVSGAYLILKNAGD